MDWPTTRARFKFLADAYAAEGGFAPKVKSRNVPVLDSNGNETGTRQELMLTGPSELVRYPRESEEKFAARNACAVYENHLGEAVDRFTGYLGRKQPQRDGIDVPLVKLLMENADLRGTSIANFFQALAAQAKARGSILLVIDTPTSAPATSLQDQINRRRVPYVRVALPENVECFRTDPESGLFVSITICGREWVDDKEEVVEYEYDTTNWRVRLKDKVLREGAHTFGATPVLAMTENGADFPVIGNYAQIADLSRRLFNARSERDEILRSQTFSLLTLQVPPEHQATFDASKVSATIGAQSMLVHSGDTPTFIAPDSGPATTYRENLEELQQSIKRISKQENTEVGAQPESGVARKLRFESLNSELATFARQLQQLEQRMWALFENAAGSGDVQSTWPTDFNLSDVAAELEILALMQAAGMPPAVLNEKRRAIVAMEFDNVDESTKAALMAAIDEYEQEAAARASATQPGDPIAAPNTQD